MYMTIQTSTFIDADVYIHSRLNSFTFTFIPLTPHTHARARAHTHTHTLTHASTHKKEKQGYTRTHILWCDGLGRALPLSFPFPW